MSENFYREKAMKHAPKSVKEIVRAVRDLSAAGHSPATIGTILGLDHVAVHELLRDQIAEKKNGTSR